MNKHVQIRNVPDSLHRRLKVRAASQGLSLSDYLRAEMDRIARLPTLKEWVSMVTKPGPRLMTTDEIVSAIHAGREERDARIGKATAVRRRR